MQQVAAGAGSACTRRRPRSPLLCQARRQGRPPPEAPQRPPRRAPRCKKRSPPPRRLTERLQHRSCKRCRRLPQSSASASPSSQEGRARLPTPACRFLPCQTTARPLRRCRQRGGRPLRARRPPLRLLRPPASQVRLCHRSPPPPRLRPWLPPPTPPSPRSPSTRAAARLPRGRQARRARPAASNARRSAGSGSSPAATPAMSCGSPARARLRPPRP